MTLQERLTKAKAALVMDKPFYASLLFRLQFAESTRVEDVGVDGVTLFYNPQNQRLQDMPMPQLKSLLCQQVMHCANAHHLRRGGRDVGEWNEACDYAVNPILQADGFDLPAGALCDPRFEGLSAEGIYKLRHSERQDAQDGQEGQEGQSGDESAAGAPQAGQEGQESGQDSQGDASGNQTDGQDASNAGQGGQGSENADASGTGQPGTSGASYGGMGCVMDFPGDPDTEAAPSPAEIADEQREWDLAMTQAAQVARMAGTLGGDLERMVTDALSPRADWEALLREFMTSRTSDDYSWIPPNRRYVWRDMYLPSAHSERLGEIVVAVDTSGSITDEILQEFAAELSAIVEDVAPEVVHVVYCDARVQRVEEFTPELFPIELHPHGGGGTRFAPVFEWVDSSNVEPACLIYFTDMCSSDLATLNEPDYPVLWADYADVGVEVPFGEHLVID